jgi:hypothetical protein
MLRRLALAASAALVLFHLWLFAGQVWAGELNEPARLTRWFVAAGIAAALVGLRRGGLSLVRGRRAVAIWLLVGLLHAPAVAHRVDGAEGLLLQQVVATLVQIGFASAAGFLLALIAWLVRAGAPRYRPSLRRVRDVSCRRMPAPDAFLLAAPRPPPSA